MPNVPAVAETKPAILKKINQKELDKQLQAMHQKYKGFNDDLIYWMVAQNNKVKVADIKAGDDGGNGEEISIAQFEAMSEDQDEMDKWTFVNGGVFEKPKNKKGGKYAISNAAIVDVERGITSKDTEKINITISDGTGSAKVVFYGKAVDIFNNSKLKVGDVVRLPLMYGQYGYWTKRGEKGAAPEEVLWYKFSFPSFGSIHKLDLPVTQFFKSLDQAMVKAKDSVFVEGVITNLDDETNEICTKCTRWWDEKKPEEHKKCKGAEIVEETSYVGTMTTKSSQIHKIKWASNPRQEIYTAKKPKINVGTDIIRVFGTVTDRNTVMATGFAVIDADDISDDVEVPAPKKGKAKPAKVVEEPEEDEEDDEEEDDAPAKPAKRRVIAPSDDDDEDDDEEEAPKPKRRPIVPAKDDEEEDEDDEEEDEEDASPPPRRVVRKSAPAPADDDEEEEDEEDEDEAPSPPPRRKAKAPEPEADEDDDEEEEDEEDAPAPVRRRPVAKASAKTPEPDGEEDEEEEEEDDEEEDEVAPVKNHVAKPAKKGAGSKVSEFIVSALTNSGSAQRVHLIARSAAKKGLIEVEDLEDDDAIKDAFQPHLEAALKATIIKYADDKQQKIWLGKGA